MLELGQGKIGYTVQIAPAPEPLRHGETVALNKEGRLVRWDTNDSDQFPLGPIPKDAAIHDDCVDFPKSFFEESMIFKHGP